MADEKELTQQESLRLITEMISKAKNSFHDTGVGPMLWGCVVTFCSLVTWARLYFDFELPFDVWLLTLVAIVPQVLITIKEKRMRRARSYDDAVIDAVWLCFGISIFLVSHINAVFINRLLAVYKEYEAATGKWPSFGVSSYSSSLMLLLYALPTVITGLVMKFRPMLLGGIAGWVCCTVSVYTDMQADMLLTAFAAVVMWLVPGLILWNKYRKQKAANV